MIQLETLKILKLTTSAPRAKESQHGNSHLPSLQPVLADLMLSLILQSLLRVTIRTKKLKLLRSSHRIPKSKVPLPLFHRDFVIKLQNFWLFPIPTTKACSSKLQNRFQSFPSNPFAILLVHSILINSLPNKHILTDALRVFPMVVLLFLSKIFLIFSTPLFLVFP